MKSGCQLSQSLGIKGEQGYSPLNLIWGPPLTKSLRISTSVICKTPRVLLYWWALELSIPGFKYPWRSLHGCCYSSNNWDKTKIHDKQSSRLIYTHRIRLHQHRSARPQLHSEFWNTWKAHNNNINSTFLKFCHQQKGLYIATPSAAAGDAKFKHVEAI